MIKDLRYWCNKILPTVFDDSLSYYEVLCKVTEKLNEVIDVVNMTDVQAEIDKYIKAHPELVTFVQDGAITEAKINEGFLPYIENDYVTPEMFGAKGDGSTDDAPAFKSMLLNNTNNKPIKLSNKIYAIKDTINFPDDCIVEGGSIRTNEPSITTTNICAIYKDFSGIGVTIGGHSIIKNLCVFSNKAVYTGNGICVRGSRTYMENISVFNCDIGIMVGDALDTSYANVNLCTFKKITCVNCNEGMHIESVSNNAQGISLYDFDGRRNGTGLLINTNSCNFYNIVTQTNSDYGIKFVNSHSCTIYGEYSETNGIELYFDSSSSGNRVYSTKRYQYLDRPNLVVDETNGSNLIHGASAQISGVPMVKGNSGFYKVYIHNPEAPRTGNWVIEENSSGNGLDLGLTDTTSGTQTFSVIQKNDPTKRVVTLLQGLKLRDPTLGLERSQTVRNIYSRRVDISNVSITANGTYSGTITTMPFVGELDNCVIIPQVLACKLGDDDTWLTPLSLGGLQVNVTRRATSTTNSANINIYNTNSTDVNYTALKVLFIVIHVEV